MNDLLPSQTPEYIEASKHCDRFAKTLATQLLNHLNNATFEPEISDVVRYPRQLTLEKVVKLLQDQI